METDSQNIGKIHVIHMELLYCSKINKNKISLRVISKLHQNMRKL